MIISVFVVEDELIHQEAIKIALEELGFELSGLCDNADDAFAQINKHNPDVVLVDIALPGINNGITLAQRIHDELHIPHVFTTSFTQEQIIKDAAKTSPSGYLTKPVEPGNLKASILLALNQPLSEPKQMDGNFSSFYTKVGDKLVRINLDDVLLVKSDGCNYISVHTHHKEVSCRCTLKEFCEDLPDYFLQIHRAYVINLNHLDSYDEKDQSAILKGKTAPVSRRYKTEFLNRLKKW
jgi:DNA-binding LytR/AlgR family response regulator